MDSLMLLRQKLLSGGYRLDGVIPINWKQLKISSDGHGNVLRLMDATGRPIVLAASLFDVPDRREWVILAPTQTNPPAPLAAAAAAAPNPHAFAAPAVAQPVLLPPRDQVGRTALLQPVRGP